MDKGGNARTTSMHAPMVESGGGGGGRGAIDGCSVVGAVQEQGGGRGTGAEW